MVYTSTLHIINRILIEVISDFQGSKGRKISVLFEGSGDYSNSKSSPKRAPCFLEELSEDERDLVNLQLQQHQDGLRNVGA